MRVIARITRDGTLYINGEVIEHTSSSLYFDTDGNLYTPSISEELTLRINEDKTIIVKEIVETSFTS